LGEATNVPDGADAVLTLKVAVHVRFAFIRTVVGEVVPVGQPVPDQPAKIDPLAAVAVIVALVFCGYVPAPVVEPDPVPAVGTASVKVGRSVKVGVHVRFWVIDTAPVVQPVPVHPAKNELAAGVATRFTTVWSTMLLVVDGLAGVVVPVPVPLTAAMVSVHGPGTTTPAPKATLQTVFPASVTDCTGSTPAALPVQELPDVVDHVVN
jgi:hypothetical protein